MIFVDSSLQVYTTVVSWKYYGVIWSLLVGTGIVFIPIVMALVGELLQHRSRGSMFSNDSDGLLSAIEVRLARVFIVMLFIAMPASPLTLDSNSIRVVKNPVDLTTPENVPATGTCASTGTPFDDIDSSDGEAICGTDSTIPVWWYGVLRVSHAITQATVSELTADTNQGFRALVSFMRSGKIKDASLQNLSNRFESECYHKALALYSNETAGNAEGPGNDDPGFFGRDIGWQGSEFLVENYYEDLSSDGVVHGITFDPDENKGVDTSVETPVAGKVNCLDFWVFLEASIFDEATSPAAGDDRASRWTRLTANIPGNNNREVLVRQYIQNSKPQGSQTTEKIFAQADRGKNGVERSLGSLGDVAQAAEFIQLSFTASFIADALIKALPILQAYILMFMVFMLPFGLVLSGYSWSFVIQSSALIFFVIFWSAIWGFASWIDDSMARVLWPGGDDGIWSGVGSYLNSGGGSDNWQQGTNKLIHSMITAAVYLMAPMWCGWILASAGVGMANFVGQGGGAAKVGSGGGTGSSQIIGHGSYRTSAKAIGKNS